MYILLPDYVELSVLIHEERNHLDAHNYGTALYFLYQCKFSYRDDFVCMNDLKYH